MKKYIILLILILISISLFASASDSILQFFQKTNIPSWLIVLLIAMMPISELRGAIPIAINVFDMQVFYAFTIAYIGNMIPIIPILLFLNHIYNFFSKWHFTKNIFDKFFEKTKSRSKQIEKYKMIGLISFVAIPLPITGAWTGAVASVLFKMKFKDALLSIFIGVFIAGIIVSIFSLMGLLGAILAGIILIGIVIIYIIRIYI